MTFDFENGEVLIINKPLHWTSFDVVNKLRYEIRRKIGKKNIKVGHAGTLDPLAGGLLIICTGKKTKEIDNYQAEEKEYTGEFFLGKTTPSYDAETEVNAEYDISAITETQIYQATKAFLGEIDQIPPIFSAIKVAGKPVYQDARKGREVALQARKITIFAFEITEIALPKVKFRVVCSKGTYIRSLAYDFGKALGAGAYLSALTRTRSGSFLLEKAHHLEDLIELIKSS
jgi:tRNA pseudouridine55 synthase